MIWPVDFNCQQSTESSQKFVEAYKAEFGEDAAELRGRGLRRGLVPGPLDQGGRQRRPEAIKEAMAEVAAKPVTGALGEG